MPLCHCCHRDRSLMSFPRAGRGLSAVCSGCQPTGCTLCGGAIAADEKQPGHRRHRDCHRNLLWCRTQARIARWQDALA